LSNGPHRTCPPARRRPGRAHAVPAGIADSPEPVAGRPRRALRRSSSPQNSRPDLLAFSLSPVGLSSSCSQMASCRACGLTGGCGPGPDGRGPSGRSGQCGPAARRATAAAKQAPKTRRRSRPAALTPSRAGSAQHQTRREKAPEPAVLHLRAAASSAVDRQRRFGNLFQSARLGPVSRKAGSIASCPKGSCPRGTWTRAPVTCEFASPSDLGDE